VALSNSCIQVTVLPEKGGDIFSFVDVESKVDVLSKTPWGLQPPGSPPREGSAGAAFLQNYEGGWQELFPNTFSPCVYKGKEIPLHGEVATLPWEIRIEQESGDEVAICLDVACRQLPLTLRRRMRLSASSSVLVIDETVRNESDDRVSFVWGHHPVLGAPFLEANCQIRTAGCTVHTPARPFEPARASLAANQHETWPDAIGVNGAHIDLRNIPGPEAGTHDHAYLTDFKRGWVQVENPRLALAFTLEWDPGIFRWLVNWRPFGGSCTPPLDGIYGVGLELWATRSNLADALETGDALFIEPHAALNTSLKATLSSTR
jgi:hypothetical protein